MEHLGYGPIGFAVWLAKRMGSKSDCILSSILKRCAFPAHYRIGPKQCYSQSIFHLKDLILGAVLVHSLKESSNIIYLHLRCWTHAILCLTFKHQELWLKQKNEEERQGAGEKKQRVQLQLRCNLFYTVRSFCSVPRFVLSEKPQLPCFRHPTPQSRSTLRPSPGAGYLAARHGTSSDTMEGPGTMAPSAWTRIPAKSLPRTVASWTWEGWRWTSPETTVQQS